MCGDAMCSDACCPEGTCDTAPECVRKVTCEEPCAIARVYGCRTAAPPTTTPSPRSRHRVALPGLAGEADGGKAMSGRSFEAWEDTKEVDNVFGKGTGGEFGAGMLWKVRAA